MYEMYNTQMYIATLLKKTKGILNVKYLSYPWLYNHTMLYIIHFKSLSEMCNVFSMYPFQVEMLEEQKRYMESQASQNESKVGMKGFLYLK